MKYGTQDCQQIQTDGSRIVSIHPGAMVVRVHECHDADHCGNASRYYLSVDLRFRAFDALRDFGWTGYTKSEATVRAKELANAITITMQAVNAAEVSTLRGKEILVQRQKARLANLVAKYEAEVILT
jgi:hypothetical protein